MDLQNERAAAVAKIQNIEQQIASLTVQKHRLEGVCILIDAQMREAELLAGVVWFSTLTMEDQPIECWRAFPTIPGSRSERRRLAASV